MVSMGSSVIDLEPPDTRMTMPRDAAKTRTVRMMEDLVTMLRVIETFHEIKGERFKAVEYLDELTRRRITADYKKARQGIADHVD